MGMILGNVVHTWNVRSYVAILWEVLRKWHINQGAHTAPPLLIQAWQWVDSEVCDGSRSRSASLWQVYQGFIPVDTCSNHRGMHLWLKICLCCMLLSVLHVRIMRHSTSLSSTHQFNCLYVLHPPSIRCLPLGSFGTVQVLRPLLINQTTVVELKPLTRSQAQWLVFCQGKVLSNISVKISYS